MPGESEEVEERKNLEIQAVPYPLCRETTIGKRAAHCPPKPRVGGQPSTIILTILL